MFIPGFALAGEEVGVVAEAVGGVEEVGFLEGDAVELVLGAGFQEDAEVLSGALPPLAAEKLAPGARGVEQVEVLLFEADLSDEAAAGGDAGADEEASALAFLGFDEEVADVLLIARRGEGGGLDVAEEPGGLEAFDGLADQDGVVGLVGIDADLAADDAVLDLGVAADDDVADGVGFALGDDEMNIDDGGFVGVGGVHGDVAVDVAFVAVTVFDVFLQEFSAVALDEIAGAEGRVGEEVGGLKDGVAFEGELADGVARALVDDEMDGDLGLVGVVLDALGHAGIEIAVGDVEIADGGDIGVDGVLVEDAFAENPDVGFGAGLPLEVAGGEVLVAVEDDVPDAGAGPSAMR